jgi:fatty-acyl-CoA synthase
MSRSSQDSPWVEGLTIGEMLRQTAARFGNREAVVFPRLTPEETPRTGSEPGKSFRWTYRELDDRVDNVARALLGLGIKKGDHVAVWATNWPRWVLLQFATARIGAVLVTINPAYRKAELAYVLRQSDARALFLVDEFRRSNFFSILNEAIPQLAEANTEELELADFPRLKRIVAMKGTAPKGLLNWDEFAALAEHVSTSDLKAREDQLKPGDPINIQYTSGTTGFPKGAMLTHRNLLLNSYYTGECQNFSEQDRVCVPVPFYHCFGCVLGVLASAVQGAAMIVPNEYFDPLATLDAIEHERATSLYGVPAMFIAELEHPTFAGRDLTSLRTGIMAGSPCPIEVMKRVASDMGASEITIGYGQTEASPIITQTNTDDPLHLRVQTVGRPIPNIEVKLVDPETGATLGDNVQGELCTRGHVVMLGYYNNPEGTKSAIDDEGWLHTGDLALRQPDGYYRITGRIRDMICRGGENIYPREIEEFLYTHPAVQDVAIVGVPDPKLIEEVAAWIRLKDGAKVTEDEIKQYCKANLAHYKTPKYVRFVTEFPQTVTGKIQKFRIRELMIEELGLKAAETA